MVQQVDLETLHHILKQFSEDILRDCPKIISKLLNSLNGTAVPEHFKTFKSIKVLLNLYEKIYTKGCETKLKLPIGLIFENLKKKLCCSIDDCNHPDNDVQVELLSVLEGSFKISSLEDSSEAVQQLMEFYDYNIGCISAASVGKEWRSDCLMFNLKTMHIIYNLLGDITHKRNLLQLFENSKSDDNVNDTKVLADLILYGDDNVAVQTLMFLIPGYINCFKNYEVLDIIWKEISNSVTQSSLKHSRIMLVLCNFFDMFFEKFGAEEKLYLTLLLFKDGNYWELLQSVIVQNDPVIRKQGMHLLKNSFEALNNTNESIMCSKEDLIFNWDLKVKNKLYRMYSNIIVILEFLDEQQVHIIKPILNKAENLVANILECDMVSPSWVLLLHQKALIHESTQIVKWGLINLLKLPQSVFAREDIARKTLTFLVPILNSPSIYYNEGLAVSEKLRVFLEKMATLNSSKLFFSSLIKQVCSLVWSPESLFFVVHALSHLPNYSFWGEDEVSQIRIFVKRTFKTYHKIIRVGIQCQLLNAISSLTDHRRVSLKNFILLISSFPLMESLERESRTVSGIINRIRACYPRQEAEQLFQSYKRQELGREFNHKSVSLVFILLYYSYADDDLSSLVVNHLSETLLSFKDTDKRLYCDQLLYDRHLAVIGQIHAANATHSISEMLKPTLPFVKDVMLYVRSRLKQISGLEEFDTCRLYLNAFENITKSLKSFRMEPEDIKSLYGNVLNDLNRFSHSESGISSVGLYCRVKFLSILLTLHPWEVDLSSLISYLLRNVNKPLEKEKSCCEQTRDIQILWGRINSEFIEGKWKILEYLASNKARVPEERSWISDDDLVKLCVEGLNTGGYGVLCPVMSVLKSVLPVLENWSEVGEVVGSIWRLMMERRKTDELKSFVKAFVEMLFQEAFVVRGGKAEEILMEVRFGWVGDGSSDWRKSSSYMLRFLFQYADLIFSNASLAVITVFIRHTQKIDLASVSVNLFCHVVGKALIFGPVERKDERLTTSVCSHIEKLRICPVWDIGLQESNEHRKLAKDGEGEMRESDEELEKTSDSKRAHKYSKYHWPERISDHYTNSEIRARAVERILSLKRDSPRDQDIVKQLIDTLLKLSKDASQNRDRYFENSHVHRVKHRVIQALLLLESGLPSVKGEREKLSSWLYESLLTENLQPSVRYLEEWLLIRVLIADEDLRGRFFDYLDVSKTFKKAGLCSLMVVGFHVGLLKADDSIETHIDGCIEVLSKFLFHQNFEVRLHAQVVICKLFEIAESKKLQSVRSRWRNILLIMNEVSSHMRDQRLRHFLKLQGDFFFNSFDALKHYSLQVIYTDLPSLTNVGPDEWIHNKMFLYCGVDPSKISISLQNTHSPLTNVTVWERRESPKEESELEDDRLYETSENYQRKVIPVKPPTLGWDEEGNGFFAERKDGLVVVASLIDRIPNLGGLARTCEIFGVSEYVLSSLRHVEDKQFTSLSVTAEKWIHVKEVKPQNLKFYLLDMKQKGYIVVGAEQTLRSQSLSSVKFPKKTILLLGNEKEGIPPNLLPFLDVCVEIPQMGIIRSLNVHVTGALFIWEYAKQIYFN